MFRSRGNPEAGESLAELVVTIAIMGLAVVILVGGLGTAILASSEHRNHATAETVVRSAAETLKARDFAYVPGGTYSLPAQSGITPSVSTVCMNGATYPPMVVSCPAGGLQQLTVSATANGVTESVVIYKRKT